MSNVRTRFAPSPTGYMHVGNLRTALYTYLQARHNDGTFILRIEDTDQGRLVEGATDIIYGTLRATGLTWDEGPDIGGPVGPYVQSERMGMFKGYAEQIVKEGLSVRETERLVDEIGKPKRKPAKRIKNPNVSRVEEELKEVLGTKININQKGSKGKIEIEFFSKEELERLIDMLKSLR